MIIRMKKVSVLLQDKDIADALAALGLLGVLHLEHFRAPQGGEIEALVERRARLQRVIEALEQAGAPPPQEGCGNVEAVFRSLETTFNGIREWEQQVRDLQAQIRKWEPWGEFNLYDIQVLRENGLHIHLLALTEAQLAALPGDAMVARLGTLDGLVQAVVCTRDGQLPGIEGQPLPEHSPRKLSELLRIAQDERDYLELRMRANAKYLDALRQHALRLESQIAFQRALAGRQVEEDGLTIVRGYCPVDALERLVALARRRQWAWLIEEPAPEDPVPTLLHNPRWVELVRPVLRFINLLPGYREHDISGVFFVFFSVFFGMLIGDAGYGLLIGLGTLGAHWKFGRRQADRTPYYLLYLLSLITVLWGLLTGTFFGQLLFPGIRPLAPWLEDPANIERLCFLIGAVHLSVAHVWRAMLRWPSLGVLGEAGWLCLLWGMFFLAGLLVLGDPLPRQAPFLFIAGPVLIALFSKPHRNLLRAVGGGLGNLAMNAVRTFTDIVSYIRLFAVGLATVAVADTFNGMAVAWGFDHPLTGFLGALILVLGHVFNMVLGAMAILVHGVRLNVLEFASHMDLEWAGIPYEPFKTYTGDR